MRRRSPGKGRHEDGLTMEQLQRREYNRKKQQRYIDNQKNEASLLKNQIKELEAELRRLAPFAEKQPSSTQHLLPWKEVADELRVVASISKKENTMLKHRRETYLNLVKSMTQWINSSKRIQRSPHGKNGTICLNNVRLAANKDCRRHGFDWITKILYHNSMQVFQKYQFPSAKSSDILADFHMDFSDPDSLQYVWRLQVDVTASFEIVTKAMSECFVKPLSSTDRFVSSAEYVDTELLASTNMTYVRKTHRSGEHVMYQNILFRDFNEKDRYVVVGQTIPDDETCPRNEYDHKSIIWIAVERASDDECRIRILRTGSHMFAQDGSFSIEQEARLFGYNLTGCTNEEVKEAKLARHFHLAGIAAANVYSGYLLNALATIRGERSSTIIGGISGNQSTLELVYQTGESPHWTWVISNRDETIEITRPDDR